MGGDRGPRCIVPAALRSLSLYPFLHITLVGAADIVEPLLSSAAVDSDRLSFRPAREQILADDPPASVLRGKRDASMRVALELVRVWECNVEAYGNLRPTTSRTNSKQANRVPSCPRIEQTDVRAINGIELN